MFFIIAQVKSRKSSSDVVRYSQSGGQEKSAIVFGNTAIKPESHYNGIVDSGGYILLAMDQLGIELKNGQRRVRDPKKFCVKLNKALPI